MKQRKSRRRRIQLAVVVVLLVGLGVGGWYKLLRVVPPEVFESIEDHYKYGSVGVEGPAGVPYWIWMVLPQMFPDLLPAPGGYLSLGAMWEEGAELPIGFTKQTIGFERIGQNCAVCHAASVRLSAQEKPTIYLGAPGRFDAQGYLRFLIACAEDPRFSGRNIVNEIAKIYDMPLIDRLLYRFVLVGATRRALFDLKETYAFMYRRPPWGGGRTDMNPFKLIVMGLEDDGSVGYTDIMPLWNQGAHKGFLLHSDGLNPTVVEAARAAALAAGATPDSIDIAAIDRLLPWLDQLPPPAYPYGIDAQLAGLGEPIFESLCASCHAFGGERTGTVISAAEVGTDRNRTDHWPASAGEAFNEYAEDYDWDFDEFTSSDGYGSRPLDGIWLRGPYLHNGSVPTLADLLTVPDSRPPTFYRGVDVYDTAHVGFVTQGEHAERYGWFYDTSVVGNGNGGHTYGTDLTDDEKRALIEFLKQQ